jgi:hypothetical protein
VVPSQRLAVETRAHPFDVYRALRVVNPSPYMFYLKLGDLTLVGASPEVMVKLEDEQAFGGVRFDDAESLLTVAGFNDVGLVIASEGVRREEDAFEQVTFGADGADLREIGADGATGVADFVASDAGAFAGFEVFFAVRGVAAGGDFVVNTSGMSSTVAAGSSTTFTVSFTPTSTGQSSTTLTIANNDSDESPYEITLTGAALPEIAITGNTVNIVNGDTLPAITDHTDFSTVEVVGGTRSRIFRITNTGVADLTLGTITVSGDFAVTSPPASPVAPKAADTGSRGSTFMLLACLSVVLTLAIWQPSQSLA